MHQYRAFEYGLDGIRKTGLAKIAGNKRYRFNYCGGDNVVVYPDAELDVDVSMTEIYRTEAPQNVTISYVLAAEDMNNRSSEITVDLRTILAESAQPR